MCGEGLKRGTESIPVVHAPSMEREMQPSSIVPMLFGTLLSRLGETLDGWMQISFD